ncbi:MAG: organomercurial lyase MerB [Parvularculaceae bacterium]
MTKASTASNTENAGILNGLRAFLKQGYIAGNTPDMQRLSLAAHRLLAEGRPVSLTRLAQAAGLSPDGARRLFETVPASAYEANDDGEITGFAGLSISPANHEFQLGGNRLYTWCVFDALFLPELLQQNAVLRTRCPATEQSIELGLAPGRIIDAAPSSAVMSILDPDHDACCNNLRGAFCDHVNLFASEDGFAQWANARGNAACVSLKTAMMLARQRNRFRFPDISFA